jgi:alkylhydroperoxidase family enzyme
MAYHPRLVRKWLVFAGQVLGKGIIVKRHREIVVLRTVWVTGAMYEFVHHAEIGAENGLSEDEIEAIKVGADAGSWTSPERELLLAADELHRESTISDATWAVLREHFDEAELLEIVMLAGQYHLVAFFVRSFGVPLEDDML